MSAKDYYGGGAQQGSYYPPQGPPQAGYQHNGYPQNPQQAYQGGGGQQYQSYGPPQGYQQGYQPQQPPQTVYVQQPQRQQDSGMGGCGACLAGMCLCCCAEELCECIF